MQNQDLISISETTRIIGVSVEAVRKMSADGRLDSCLISGDRAFDRADVKRFAIKRAIGFDEPHHRRIQCGGSDVRGYLG
jgi:hypothetical protein